MHDLITYSFKYLILSGSLEKVQERAEKKWNFHWNVALKIELEKKKRQAEVKTVSLQMAAYTLVIPYIL